MTRTEKYQKYREEIKHSFFKDKEMTTKEQSSELVDQIFEQENREDQSLSFDEVMTAHKIYEDGSQTKTRKKLNTAKKKQILFVIISTIVIVSLVVALIIVGIQAFGGK